ncbi:hypothetical protein ACIOWI_29610 [Streptomyces sp. NPDC087659]|uniref:hypothetical protein n=1 Tax=Streptomyces sp. NPDC087659 TaxID=3365801 RepID=UPI00381A7338
MPESKAEISVRECRDHGWFDRRILGWAWWWSANIPYGDSRTGFARTRAKAKAKAEAAVRTMAWQDNAPYERYRYGVTDADA